MQLAFDIILYCANGWLLIILVTALATAPDERRTPSLFKACSGAANAVYVFDRDRDGLACETLP